MSVSFITQLTTQEKIDIAYMNKLVHLTTKDALSNYLFAPSVLSGITRALHERGIPCVHHNDVQPQYCFAMNILPKDMEQGLYEHIESIVASEPVLSKIWTIARVFPITLTFTGPSTEPDAYNQTQGRACFKVFIPESFGPSLSMGSNKFKHIAEALNLSYEEDENDRIDAQYDVNALLAICDVYEQRTVEKDIGISLAIDKLRQIIAYARARNIDTICVE